MGRMAMCAASMVAALLLAGGVGACGKRVSSSLTADVDTGSSGGASSGSGSSGGSSSGPAGGSSSGPSSSGAGSSGGSSAGGSSGSGGGSSSGSNDEDDGGSDAGSDAGSDDGGGVFFTEFPIPTPDSEPSGIVTGSDGNLWFTEGEGNKIGRITTTGGPTDYIGRMTTAGALAEFPIPTLEAAPLGITTGPNGNLWFVESGGGRSGA